MSNMMVIALGGELPWRNPAAVVDVTTKPASTISAGLVAAREFGRADLWTRCWKHQWVKGGYGCHKCKAEKKVAGKENVLTHL